MQLSFCHHVRPLDADLDATHVMTPVVVVVTADIAVLAVVLIVERSWPLFGSPDHNLTN